MFRQSSLLGTSAQGDRPACWSRYALSLYDEPLTMHYTGLDPSARYSLEVVYDLTGAVQIHLIANGEEEVPMDSPIRSGLRESSASRSPPRRRPTVN